MAYNNYFPATYQPAYYMPYYQQQPQMQVANQQSQQPSIQQSGFVLVQSEQEARSYPVAPGNSITFKDESQPYCYVKTMGFSQLDRPTFERYRLVKEDSPITPQNAPKIDDSAEDDKYTTYALKSDLNAIWSEIDAIKEKLRKPVKKKAEVDDDDE